MKKTLVSLAVLTAVSLSVTAVNAAGNYSYTTPAAPAKTTTLQGKAIYVPAGIVVPAVTTSVINSQYLTTGSQINLTLPGNFMSNGVKIAPAGSMVNGIVLNAKKAGRANRNGELQIRFTSIITTSGQRIPISAIIKTDDNSGILKGGTKVDAAKDYAKNTAIGAGSGAALGTALGAIVGNSGEKGKAAGKGAVYGTAIGGGLGVTRALINKGEDVEIPSGATLDLYFDQPITYNQGSSY